MNKAGNWSRASIQRDRDRFERAHPEARDEGDGCPAGMTPEEAERLGWTSEPVPWDSDHEPTIDGWVHG